MTRRHSISLSRMFLNGLFAIVALVLVLVLGLLAVSRFDVTGGSSIRDDVYGAAIGGIAVLALTAFVGVWLARAIREPLATVSGVAEAVNRGETDRRVPALGTTEFDTLGQNLNHMLDSLAATMVDADLEQQRTAAIVDSASEAIVVVDSGGLISTVNPSAARMFEVAIEDALGRPAAELGFFSDAEVADFVERVDAAPSAPIVRRRGERVLSAAVSTLRGALDGESSGSVWVLRDVTELAQIDEMKSEFISIVSHELRTPLTAIKGFTDLILEGEVGEISEQQREFLEIVQSNSDRLVALINDMLDISRIEAGRITLNPEEVDTTEAIERAVSALRPLIDEKGLSLQTELSEDAPSVVADPYRLQQILTNLISNACKYTPAGGWITVSSEAQAGQTAISVSDTGIGIPPEALPHIFSKFYRVDQPLTRDIGGTGLGLAITKSLVEMHGGRVAIASRVGIGTTVRFTLPTTREARDASGARPPADERSERRVLIVTDDPAERRVWEEALSALPANVVVARNGTAAAAISEAELHRPSVIVARCGPDHSGLPTIDELAAELQADAELRQTPLLVIAPATSFLSHTGDVTVLGESAGIDEIMDAVRELLPATTGMGQRYGRVLVAEDDGDMAAWLRRVLTRGGFEVTLVRDGLAAIVKAIEILPDAVIVDVNMPKMGADEVLRHLLGNPSTRDIPVIVISGTVPDSRPHFIDAGAADFFAKPFNGDLLVRRLVQLGRSTPHG